MSGPIEGFRIVELGQGIPAAVAGMHLGDGGADVIKVETPAGDLARTMPPFWESGDSAVFVAINRNKRSVVLDLSGGAGREQLRKLIDQADVLIEDADFTRELGLEVEDLITGNPKLVHCRITGWGPNGPMADLPGGELPAQMAAEATTSLGRLGEPPIRLGTDAASTYTGIYAAQGSLAALWRRYRDGMGQRVDVSLFGCMVMMRSTLWAALSNPDEWFGFHNDSYVRPPDTGYQCKDGAITVVVGRIEDEQFAGLMTDLGMDELSTEEQQMARMNIGANSRLGHVYKPVWEKYLGRFTVDEVAAMLNKRGGNAYRHNDYPHLFEHPQTQHLDFLRQVPAPAGDGSVTVMAPPWQFSDAETPVRMPPPGLGQHTEEVLAELGIRA